MKIKSLLQEGITAASSPENAESPAPIMGRSDKFLESENTDMTGKTCEKCKKGEYQETGVQDDMHGVLHCTKCGNETKRWKNYKEPVSETSAGATGSGSIASVASPVGGMQRRGKGSIFAGIKTSSKYPNSKTVKESVDPMNFDSDEDYYNAVKKQGQQQFSGDWDVYDEIASLENQIKYTKSSALAHQLYKQIDQLKQQAGIEDDEDEYEKEYDADIRARKGMAEGEEMSTFAALKDWRVWDVHVYNNFYRGKYADYGPRLYSVVASSPEEARQVVINNPDYVLQDLLSRKLQSGKRVLPRGSALPIEEKRVGKAEPGTITTMAFKKMLTPDGVQSFKFTHGKIVDGAHVQGGEEVEEGLGGDMAKLIGIPVVAGAAAIGAQHYDDQQPHVQVGGQNAKIVQYGSSRIPDSAMLLKGQDGKMYRVWQQSGKGMNKITLASPAEPVKEQELDEKSVSKAQFRTMAAVAHNPEFAKKVGISQKVGKEFHKADKKSDYEDLPSRADEEKQRLDPKCWSGYKKQGTKMKGGVRVNNCVKVDEGEGNFAKAIDNLHGWYQVKSNKPELEIYEFDDREGGFYADGTVYHNTNTGRVKIEFEDKMGEYGGMNVDETFNSIGDAMNVLRQITIPIRSNNGKAQKFDRLSHRKPATPDKLRKTDRTGRKGTIGGAHSNDLKYSIQANKGKLGPKGVLPEGEIAEDKLAQDLYRDLQIFKKGADKDIGSKAKDKEIGQKPKDKDIIAKEAANAAQQAAIAIAKKKEQDVSEDWQKTNKHDKTDGMSPKAVKAYRRENPGSKLQTAVTKKPSELKAGSKDAKRRKSFCARMSGNPGPMKDEHGKPTPKAKALKRWNC